MKTKILVLGVGVAAFTLRAAADDVLLSPRPQDNQIKAVSGSTTTPTATVNCMASAALFSPRATDNQTRAVAGVTGDTGSTLACSKLMTASPKAIAACEANTGAMPGLQSCGGGGSEIAHCVPPVVPTQQSE